jgi:hypothetical protein
MPIAEIAYSVSSLLARVPWWAWLAVIVMILWGLLVPDPQDG